MSIALAMLVPMMVFANGNKFITVKAEGNTQGIINITNANNKSPLAGKKLEKFVEDPGLFRDTTEDLEVQNAAVIQGKTVISLTLSPNTEYGLKVYPIIGKKSNTVFVLGPEIEDAAKNNMGWNDAPKTLPKDLAVELSQDGEYIIELFISSMTGGGTGRSYIKIENGETPKSDPAKPGVNKLVANPASSKVLVDQKPVSFEAYTIEDNNYIKLRDFAYAVRGTKKQFEVAWDPDKRAINLVSSQAYSANGTELAKGDGKAKAPILNKDKIYLDGNELALKAYTIGGNNYFKLRDLAGALGIEVTWDPGTSTIGINPSHAGK